MKDRSYILLAILLSACSTHSSTDERLTNSIDSAIVVPDVQVSDKTIQGIMQSIPSPLEISTMIKESGGDYDRGILNKVTNASNYNTTFKKSINLGVFSTDLGYINIYNKSSDALSYISCVKGISDDLGIGQFFDLKAFKRIAENNNNYDSLLLITTSTFEDINRFLKEKKRSEQSILMLSGGWIEALHIALKVHEANHNEDLKEKIGEQKIVLEKIVLLLSNYKVRPEVQSLLTDLEKLNEVYKKVEINYTYQESVMKEVDGVLVVEDQTTSKVIISDDQLNQIRSIVGDLRNRITV
ncbi:hypothetical protein MYP_4389 [Sporocytophaga myxococcoides]|uniref:Lipoprotein n=1 Tax=Sporocytophaga myxococcoides TaxID=153721 RepID=A0A098LKX1_9BACT|nr:hypothetical protein [Sporocytophaga myxococcoides]GAL87159.1 hypothetical protein MYP_4389 [Sporocytophaga myxococcoides]